jgi:hypothetical protein
MPRRARIALPNVPVHLIQRGNNRQPCFFADEDFRRYMDWPTDYAGKIGGRVHAKALMTNHVHFDFCRPCEWPDLVDEIRRATNDNFELGSETLRGRACYDDCQKGGGFRGGHANQFA